MPDQDRNPDVKPDQAPRKHKSYRDADTQMRVKLDAQQEEVANKVDDVIASLREKPLRQSSTREETLAPTAPTISYRRDLDQPAPLRKLIFAGLLACGLGLGFYFYTRGQSDNKATPAANVVQNPPVIDAAPTLAASPVEPAIAGTEDAPITETPPVIKEPTESKPKEPAPVKKKPSRRYSENI